MPVQTEILDYYSASNIAYNLFFALDGFLNIVLCFFAGSLLHDRLLGINKTMLISSTLIVVGNLLLGLSAIKGHFTIALVGRVFAGIGLECQNVAVYAFIALWFGDSNHGLALSVSVLSIRFGCVLSGYLVPIVYHSWSRLDICFHLMTAIALLGLLCVAGINFIDSFNKRRVKNALHREDTLT